MRHNWYAVAWIGLAAAAILHGLNDWGRVATMPVPITEANQLGPRWAKTSAGRSRSRNKLRPRAMGRAGTTVGAAS